jgi:DNA-directed RNA polymerase beta subunit
MDMDMDTDMDMDKKEKSKKTSQTKKYAYLKSPPEAWIEISKLLSITPVKKKKDGSNDSTILNKTEKEVLEFKKSFFRKKKISNSTTINTPLSSLLNKEKEKQIKKTSSTKSTIKTYLAEEGRKWLYNKFMNPRSYNLGKQGRLSFNKKLGLNILPNQTTLTGLDVLHATDYLIKVEKGIFKIDDIDHLKNRRVRTSGELIQIQIGIGLVRLEKSIRENLNKLNLNDILDLSPTDFKKYKYKQSENKNPNLIKPVFLNKTNKIENVNSFSLYQTKNQELKLQHYFELKKKINSPFYSPFENSYFCLTRPVPAESVPAESVPAESVPAESVPAESVPSERKESIAPKAIDKSSSTLLSIAFAQTTNTNFKYLKSDNIKIKNGSINISDSILPSKEKEMEMQKFQNYLEFINSNPLHKSDSSLNINKHQRFTTTTKLTTSEIKTKNNNKKAKNNSEIMDNENNLILNNFINSKAFNSAIREFFGTSPLSQFMDQINPLAELTHKRRLSSMGPGGVTRDTATLAIRGIHPTHYGRICPIETPEGKNTGLVNSMTTYARVNLNGIIESPFYKVYKGQVQKNTGMYFFSAEQEEQIKLAAADLSTSSIGFLPKALIPVRIAEEFTKIPRTQVQFVGVSPLQMISIATSLIPFLEHDDANRALMGSNMQRQAVPLIKPERPIVGTGLEARTISDSGHVIIAKSSGFVTYVSSNKIILYSLCS